MKIRPKILYIITAFITIAMITGCANNTNPKTYSELSASDYLTLAAEATANEKAKYQLTAADKFIESQNSSAAQNVLSTISSPLTPQQTVQKQLIETKIALLNGQNNIALTLLNTIAGNNVILASDQQILLHQLLADTYEATGNTSASIRERSLLQPLLTDKEAQQLNLVATWHSLQALSVAQLQTLASAESSQSVQGWLQLALLTKQSQSPNELADNIKQWKAEYPDHPATTLLPKNISEKADTPSMPQNIALLLPLHGNFAGEGAAIRNGFLAAYYAAQKKQGATPHIKIYDTVDTSIKDVYQKAVANGAQFIVGPLLKDDLKTLAQTGDWSVPTLALNTLTDTSSRNRNLYQFGLSPLDEAAQAVTYAQTRGYKRAVIIMPNTAWSKSISAVFMTLWKNNKGSIIDQLVYNNTAEFSNHIQQLLGLTLANQNYLDLKSILHRQMRFIPRRRTDIDMIYLVAQPNTARQIIPLLKYYYASQIPVYSTSQIYDAGNNLGINRDLNGVFFCDMPWVLDPGNESPELKQMRQQIEVLWPSSYSHYKKLYALGIDAYTILTKLNQMKALPQFAISGATGDLYLDQAQHIYRKLLWSRFQNGTPQLLK